MRRQTVLVVLCTLMLIGCSVPAATPSSQLVVVTDTPGWTAVQPTATRRPSLTPVLEPTETLLPTTPTPRPFLQLVPEQPAVLVGTPIALPGDVISPENAGQLLELARWGKGFVYDVQYAPKGDLIAVATSLGIFFYDTASGAETELIETSYPIREIAFSPDGRLLATSGDEIVVWNLEKRSLAYALDGWATDLEFSSSGEWLVISESRAVRLFRASDGTEVYSLSTGDIFGGKVTFTPDEQSIVSVSEFGTLRIWNVATGDLLEEVFISEMSSDENGHAECVSLGDMAVAPNGQMLVVGCDEFAKLMIVGLPAPYLIRALDTTDWIQSVAFSPDGQRVATGDYSGNVQVWDTESGQLLLGFGGAGSPELAFSPDGAALAVGYFYSEVTIRRMTGGQMTRQLSGQTPYGGSLAISPDGSLVAVGAYRDVQLRQTLDGAVVRTLDDQPTRAMRERLSMEFPVISRLARSGPGNVVTDVAFSFDGGLVAASYDAGDVRIWQANNGHLVTVLATDNYARNVIFSPGGRYLAVECYKVLMIFDAKTWKQVEYFQDRSSLGAGGFALSPDGTRLAWVNGDNVIRLWDTSTWSERHMVILENFSYAGQLAFLGDNTTLAVITENGLQLWDSSSLELRSEDGNSTGVASAAAISPDNRLLVTLGASGYLAGASNYIWDLNSQRVIARFGTSNEHSGYYSAAFTPNGKSLIVAADDGTVRLWGVVDP